MEGRLSTAFRFSQSSIRWPGLRQYLQKRVEELEFEEVSEEDGKDIDLEFLDVDEEETRD